MQFYLNAVMSGKAEEEQSSIFLFVIDERGREIFNTFAWNKEIRDGVETEEDDITVKAISKVWRLLSTKEKCDSWKKEIVHKKSTTWWSNRGIHHTIEELII